MSNITLMMIAGIVVQGLAECFISPRYLEYFSLQAPKGELFFLMQIAGNFYGKLSANIHKKGNNQTLVFFFLSMGRFSYRVF